MERKGRGSKYRRGHRLREGEKSRSTGMEEEELVLRLTKNELFNTCILLPHAEVSSAVYEAVNQFVTKYSGDKMTLTIMSGPVSEVIQDVFRESYRSHYEDEFLRIAHYLKQRYLRAAVLLLISVAAFWISSRWLSNMGNSSFLASIIGQISIFCLWEVGYTHFDRANAAKERNRILRAMDAEITFSSASGPAGAE